MLIYVSLQLDENQSLPVKPLSSQAEAQSLSREHHPSPVEPQLLSEDSSTSKKDGNYVYYCKLSQYYHCTRCHYCILPCFVGDNFHEIHKSMAIH